MSGKYYSLRGGVRRQLVWRLLSKWLVACCLLSLGAGMAAGVIAPSGSSLASQSVPAAAKPAGQVAEIAASDTPALQPPDVGAQATAAVQAALSANSAESWSVAAYDLVNNRWLVQLNDNQQMTSASLYKLYVTFALAKKLPFSQWSTKQVVGHTVKDCVDLMLKLSDNTCGEALAGFVGYSMIDRIIYSYGFTTTTLDNNSGPLTTASDMTHFMSNLYQGQLFDPDASNFILTSLANQQYRSAIPAGCPGCTVYNKTGLLSNVANDTAIVKSSRLTYAVTIMSTGGSYQKIANVEQALQTALAGDAPQTAE